MINLSPVCECCIKKNFEEHCCQPQQCSGYIQSGSSPSIRSLVRFVWLWSTVLVLHAAVYTVTLCPRESLVWAGSIWAYLCWTSHKWSPWCHFIAFHSWAQAQGQLASNFKQFSSLNSSEKDNDYAADGHAIFPYAIVHLRPCVAGLWICQRWLFPSSQKDSGRVPDVARPLENAWGSKQWNSNAEGEAARALQFVKKAFQLLYLPIPSNSLAGCCGQTSCYQYLVCLALVLCHSRQIFCSGALRQQSENWNCRTFPDESAVAAPVVTPQDWGLLCHCVHSLKLILFFQRGTCVALDGRFSAVHLATLSDRILFSTHSTKWRQCVRLGWFWPQVIIRHKAQFQNNTDGSSHQKYPLTSSKNCNFFIAI